MTTLTEFLLARITEDEQVARTASWFDRPPIEPTPDWTYKGDGYEVEPGVTHDREGIAAAVNPEEGTHIARHDPARVLAECEAKRRIIAMHGELCFGNGDRGAGDEVLEHLAQVYADHPSFDPTWKA